MLKINVLILLILSNISLRSQESLSLSDAIQTGLSNNYDILIEQGNVESSQLNNSWGEAGRLPTVRLNVNQNNSLTDNVKVAFPTATRGETLVNNVAPGITLDWTLFNGFKINITKERLAALQQESEGNAAVVMSNTIQAIILGYYKAIIEKEKLTEFQKQLDLSRDKYEYTQLKKEIGSSVSTDLLLEEGNYLTDSTNYLNQQLTLRNAVRDLNVLLGEEDVTKEYLFAEDLSQFKIETYDLADLTQRLNDDNVDLRKQYISQSILSHDIRLRKADRMPTLTLNSGFNDNRQRLDLSNAIFFTGEGFTQGPNEALNSVTDTYFVNFTLAFTLFDGGKINRAIKNAQIQEDIGNLRAEQLKNSLLRDLVRSYDQYNIRTSLFQINARREEAAEVNLDISQDKFQTGVINSFDFRTIQNTYLSASIQKLQSLYDVIDSKVSLMRLTGGIIETYNR
ncbi:MAG: TolC family protein [Bacteroidota bacterium]